MPNPIDIGKALSGQNPKVIGNVGDRMADAGKAPEFAKALGGLPTDQAAFAMRNMDPAKAGQVAAAMDPGKLTGIMGSTYISPDMKGQIMNALPVSLGTQVMSGVASVDSGMAARIGTNMDPQSAANIFANMKGQEGPSRGMPMSSQVFAHPQDMTLQGANSILSKMPNDVSGSILNNISGNYPGFYAMHGGTLMYYPDHGTMIRDGMTTQYVKGADGSWRNQAGETPEQAAARLATGGFNRAPLVSGAMGVTGTDGSTQAAPVQTGVQEGSRAPLSTGQQQGNVLGAQTSGSGMGTAGNPNIICLSSGLDNYNVVAAGLTPGGQYIVSFDNGKGTGPQYMGTAQADGLGNMRLDYTTPGVGTVIVQDAATGQQFQVAAKNLSANEMASGNITPVTYVDSPGDVAMRGIDPVALLGGNFDVVKGNGYNTLVTGNTFSETPAEIRANSPLCGSGSSINPLSGLPAGVQAFLDYRMTMAKQPINVVNDIPLSCYGTKAAVIKMPDGTMVPAVTNAVFTVPVSYGAISSTIAQAAELAWNPWAYGYEGVSNPSNPVIIDGAEWLANANGVEQRSGG